MGHRTPTGQARDARQVAVPDAPERRAPSGARDVSAWRAKLNPPSVSSSQVERAAIHALVGGAPAVRLVLVRAPAGFGKTTAMIQMRRQMEEKGSATAWLTLDQADNDASRFLSCLDGAVSHIVAGRAPDAAAARALATPRDVVLRLADALADFQSPFALFLDEFEHVQDPVVLGLLREILVQLPRNGRMVIGSRTLPALGLGQLRGRGQMLDIDASHLRFSLPEAGEFLCRRRLPLRPEDLSALHQKTEGWVAALWLASLALERRGGHGEFIGRFSGSNQAVTQYLADDVLAQQPPALRDFLLRTSILRYLDAPLCDALTGRGDSAALLRQLDAANLFLTPIDGEQATYRYHGLFADFLQGQLAIERPGQAGRLHLAASRWFASQGRPVPAIDHAIDANDTAEAIRLLAGHARELLAQGRIRLLTRWFDALPEAALRPHPDLQAVRVWALCMMRGPGEALALLERCECGRAGGPATAVSIVALRPVLLAMMDDYEQASAIGGAALAAVPAGDTFAHTMLTNAMADVYSVLGQYQQARTLLGAARLRQGESGAFNAMYSESVEGIIDLHEGRIRQAGARFRMALRASHQGSYSQAHGNAWAGVLHANALYEADDCAQAEHLLNIYLPLAISAGIQDHMITAHVTLSRIAFQRGDVDLAFQMLTELEYLGHRRGLRRLVAGARLERARVYGLQGHLDAAGAELERADDRGLWPRLKGLRLVAHDVEYLELGRLRHQVAAGRYAAALPLLDGEIAAALDASRHRRALALRLLRAVALHGHGDHRGAHAALGGLLRATCNEGAIHLVLDEGPRAGALLRSYMAAQFQGRPDQGDPLFAEYLQRLLQGFGPATEPEAAAAPGAMPAEALTRQELRVLALLAEGHSNIAIGEKMFVSANTVRTHLRGVNAKLGATSRTQAVALARRLGVIG
ncbi:LuxR C-terminal-related transcriptional regulator [Pseudoduganella namucuonensis]|uniref:LuxR family transcriptional regulator, maltose regulon positive regulatory protein n=1 Tax=Pseudoduganella namucuonensis TaxID=1035707 RepID=A0A1I7M0I7_9BURK|nr:LuxR C-terminal-related transcriptional regulator [Pseudoduganella namucuonensis]SFV15320.1 LuxR family transcriptional regulator, maltose regulon positive regulatory protein [Pseudoduganella namucuonensis]